MIEKLLLTAGEVLILAVGRVSLYGAEKTLTAFLTYGAFSD